ncbi:MAG: DNA polymerase III subunit beta, partial [Lysobacterales bacterium]
MKFTIQREALLHPISQVVGVVERRQTLPVLANFLVSARDGRLSVTGTDMEVELVTSVAADIQNEGEITVPARKLVDIVRMLPESVGITVVLEGDKLTISSGRGRYTLATLPANEFPATDQVETLEIVKIQEHKLKNLL